MIFKFFKQVLLILAIILMHSINVKAEKMDYSRIGKISTSKQNITEERILFLNVHGCLTTVRPDGSDENTIAENISYFTVSPSGRLLIAFLSKAKGSNKLKAQLYDLQKGIVYPIAFPDGYWVYSDCWWSDGEQKLHLFSGTTTEGKPLERPFNISDFDSRINYIATFDTSSRNIEIEHYKGYFPILRNFLLNEYPKIQVEYVSPNEGYKLFFKLNSNPIEYRELTLSDLFLVQSDGINKKLIFNKDDSKFGNGIQITPFAWSPDSTHFVMSEYQSGFWKELTTGTTYHIYTINIKTLKWVKIADGYYPYWFNKFPSIFTTTK